MERELQEKVSSCEPVAESVAEGANDGTSQLNGVLQRLWAGVESTDYQLSNATFHQVLELFRSVWLDPSHQAALRRLSPEYGQSEFLLNIDPKGAPVLVDRDMIREYRETNRCLADFGRWFQESIHPEIGQPTLLIARWLCHLAGFRHQVVQMFIDHPTLEDHTLVQVRGLNKVEYPGCFDMPVAGHVVAWDSAGDALTKELLGELGWRTDDLDNLYRLGRYGSNPPSNPSGLRSVEYRLVFISRFKPDSLLRARFVDREVAGLAVFRVSELLALNERFPDRLGAGLRDSLPLYLKNRPW